MSVIVLSVCCSAFIIQIKVPDELTGKWKLRGSYGKLIGTIEIKSSGAYNYSVSPNYKESGTLILNTRKVPKEIDLVVRTTKGASTITRGIYRINNNNIELCLAKMNEVRPVNFNNDQSRRSVTWIGTR